MACHPPAQILIFLFNSSFEFADAVSVAVASGS